MAPDASRACAAVLRGSCYGRRDGGEVTEDCYLVDVPGPDEPALGSDPEARDPWLRERGARPKTA